MALALDPRPSPLTLARGARRAEAVVLDRLDSLAEEARRTPALLARPVLVVVPSASLAQHLAAAWMRRRAEAGLRAAAGVSIRTLFLLAAGVLERAGEPLPRGGLALEVLARRFAERQRRLAAALGPVRDGFGAVVGTVRDLLDAGFTADHLPAVDEQLAALEDPHAAGPRAGDRNQAALAREIARVAAACAVTLRGEGLGRPGDIYSRAAERLAVEPGLLPSRAVLVHGFANATGLALDLLEVLTGKLDAEVVLDLPPDLAAAGGTSLGAPAGIAFASRLAWRLGGIDLEATGWRDGRPAEGEPPELEVVVAPGAHAEAWDVALAARELIAVGAVPETIGIVARDLEPYRLPLRRALARLGVPFSAPSAEAAPNAVERRLAALLDLLATGARASADRWLAALEGATPAGLGNLLDLRVGLRSLGAARLDDVAELAPGEVLVHGALPLPVRLGAEEPDEQRKEESNEAHPGPAAAPRLARRHLPGAALRSAVAAARRLVVHLENPPSEAPLERHLAWLRTLVAGALSWPEDDPARQRVGTALAWLAAELPAGFVLAAGELPLLLRRALEETSRRPLGGSGGGVLVANATEARGRTFSHLFVVGVNRDLFPRQVVEDPLLPDGLRRALRVVLPDLPVKEEGHAEERYLFAQLLSAAEKVTLSFRETNDDGEPQAPSPLLERLRLALVPRTERAAPHPHELARAERLVPPPHEARPGPPGRLLLPADEQAVTAALAAGRAGLSRLLPQALAASGLERPEEVARVRLAALDELDPDLATSEGRRRAARLGPYLGWIGGGWIGGGWVGGGWVSRREPASPAEPEEVFVTELERLSACAWQAFLERGLRLEPAPDPLASLAALDGLLVGEVVHAVVERWVRQAGGRSGGLLAEALAAPPVAWAWPPEAELGALVQEVATAVARERGVPLLALPLARRAGVFLAAAEKAGLAQGAPVFGAELEGEVTIGDAAGRRQTVRFRADLAQAAEEGVLLTDLKVGSRLTGERQPAKREDTRQRHLLEAVRTGKRLQAAAYALAEDRAGRAVAGRYLLLGRPEEEGRPREYGLAASDEVRARFAGAVGTLAAARERGFFLPRLLDDSLEEKGPACAYCAVIEACSQGDSGSTRRLARWVTAAREGSAGEGSTSAGAAAFALFELHAHPRGTGGGEE